MPRKRLTGLALLIAALAVAIAFGLRAIVRRPSGEPDRTERLAWWRDARFGIMIHWGSYSQLGVEASFPLHDRTIPRERYEALAGTFCPTEFDAAFLARLVRRAGARYLIFTAKHHDGFAMFDSAATDYKITRTPFRRDVCRELAAAARREDLRVGFYFSIPDWHHPAYYDSRWPTTRRMARHEKPETFDVFARFYTTQVLELLTRYAPVDILWFDGAQMPDCLPWIDPALVDVIRRTAPLCLLNDRLVPSAADFVSLENVLPADWPPPFVRAWEVAVPISGQWAYRFDADYRSSEELFRLLDDVRRRGGNFLLNFGLGPTGAVDPAVAERLADLGRRLEGEAASRPALSARPD